MSLWLAFLAFSAGAADILDGPIPAQVIRVIDGDTVEVRARIWLGTEVTTLVRLRGIDAPEMKGGCPGEPEAAERARRYLAALLGDGMVTLTQVGRDKYGGRVDAHLRAAGGADPARAMLEAGHVRPWRGHREKWC